MNGIMEAIGEIALFTPNSTVVIYSRSFYLLSHLLSV